MNHVGECDIVLKGGMTSGVLYPALLARLSTRFRFRRLGGSSAGAIAAAFGAAAEHGRQHGRTDSFEMLECISNELKNPERLGSLFAPDARTKDLFEQVNLILKPDIGFRPLRGLKRLRTVMRLVTGDRAIEPWVANGMGLCTGMTPGAAGIALVPWIHAHLNALAGLHSDDVLTFGMLRSSHAPIDLKLVATALEIAKRVDLPVHDPRWGFDPDLWRRIFPDSVIEFMHKRAARRSVSFMPSHVSPFPAVDDLPVIVAVRMSMAFPGLFTPVPVAMPDPARRGKYCTVHLADGGITSNLPSTLFDEPIPSRPTFIINLRYGVASGRRNRRGVESSGVWMPRSAGDGNVEIVEAIECASSRMTLVNLAMAVVTAARTWTDNRWLRMPGYRERIVEIWLDPDEGGLNLRMSEASAAKLIAKGVRAAEMLIDRFGLDAFGKSDGFARHVRHRKRLLTGSVLRFAHRWRKNFDQTPINGSHVDAQCATVIAVNQALQRIAVAGDESQCPNRCRSCGSRGGVPRLMFTGETEYVTDQQDD